jgi:hypothetical protein
VSGMWKWITEWWTTWRVWREADAETREILTSPFDPDDFVDAEHPDEGGGFIGVFDYDPDYEPPDPEAMGTAPWTPFDETGHVRKTLFTEEGWTQIGTLRPDA